MSLTENESATMHRYDANAAEWLEYSGGADRACFWQGEMETFTNLLAGKTVAEIGAGPATDGKYLIQKGLDVVSTDYSQGMLSLAKSLRTNDKLVQSDMYHLPFSGESFDGFWATASLLHLENPNIALSEIARISKKGAHGFITIKEGEGEMIDPRTGYYFHYFRDSEFVTLLTENGMEVVSKGRKDGTKNHDWLTYLVRVNK